MSMRKRVLFISIIAVVIIAVVTAVLLVFLPHKPSKDQVEINRITKKPLLVYEKFIRKIGNRRHYHLMMFELGTYPQKIDEGLFSFTVGAKGRALIYKTDYNENFIGDIYMLTSNGVRVQCAEMSAILAVSEDQYKMLLHHNKPYDTYHLLEYTHDGDIVGEQTIDMRLPSSIEWNSDFSIFYLKNASKWNYIPELKKYPANYDWGALYIYEDGTKLKIADNTTLSYLGESVADNGAVLYISEMDEETRQGTLYLKEKDKSAQQIVENATGDFAISNEGKLIAAQRVKPDKTNALFYQFGDNEPSDVENVKQFKLSEDGSTLYCTVETGNDGLCELYRIKADSEPALVDEEVAWLVECSEDGDAIAYMSNYENEYLGDLYIARVSSGIEFVDTGVRYVGMLDWYDTVNMYRDGSAIAYLKTGYEEVFDTGDLYIKQNGQAARLVDENVIFDFDFIE